MKEILDENGNKAMRFVLEGTARDIPLGDVDRSSSSEYTKLTN